MMEATDSSPQLSGTAIQRRRTTRVAVVLKKSITYTTTTSWRRTIVCIIALSIVAGVDNVRAATNSNPISLGLRSALAHSFIHQYQLKKAPSRRKSKPRSSSFDDLTATYGDDDTLVESAFSQPTSKQAEAQLHTSRSAYLRVQQHRTTTTPTDNNNRVEQSELEYLEESMRTRPSSRATTASLTMTRPILDAINPGGAAAATAIRPLAFWESMVCGAISRTVAQTTMHPANTLKTLLQQRRGADAPGIVELMQPRNLQRLWTGAGANFLLSVPHGAVNFAVLEVVRKRLGVAAKANPNFNEKKWGAGLDFLSSCISTVTCSVVSTPQMMITDNIMAGNYPNLPAAISGLAQTKGVAGFYAGWWPGLVGKIPSYAFTWTFFQQLKLVRDRLTSHPATDVENSILGCVASATTVCLMIPMDTIKTRLVTQAGKAASDQAYKGIIDCAVRVFREEGAKAFYRGLPPRLVSVVPMIGIQFGVYEFMKKAMVERTDVVAARKRKKKDKGTQQPDCGPTTVLEEAMMEVAASPEHPFPAPQFKQHNAFKTKKKKS